MFLDALLLAGCVLAIILFARARADLARQRAHSRGLEARLGEAEGRARVILDSMVEAVLTLHPDGTIVDVNSAALDIFGHARTDLIGASALQLLAERHRVEVAAYLEQLRGEDTVRGDFFDAVARRADGSERLLKVAFGKAHFAGELVFTLIARDISERKRITDALRASEAQLRMVIDAAPALIAYVDAEGRFRLHNKRYEEYFNLSAEQIDGRTLREVLGDEVAEVLRPRVEQVLQGYPVHYERTHRDANGETRDLAGSFLPHYGEGEHEGRVVGFYTMVTDVSALKRVSRMKSEFVSVVSHELRTPLTSIRGSLGLLGGGVSGHLPPAVKGLVDIATNNCDRLIRLINDILDTEKIESGKMDFAHDPIDMGALVKQAVESNQGFAAQHRVTLDVDTGGARCPVEGDADRLEQVVTNLVSNAVKFSPEGATVAVAVSLAGGRVRVEVCDRGPGIPASFRGRIFQKFSQADSSDTRLKGGTGLGLSISKAIVERHGGAIGFRDAPGGGTVFHFELPCWRQVEAPPAQGVRALAHDAPRILYVEEDRDMQRVTAAIADFARFDFAATLQEARALLRERRYDLVLLDLALPDGSGWALLADISQLAPRPKVAIFSATEITLAEDARVEASLVKSRTSNEDLAATLRSLVAPAPARIRA
jgi:PAS domain S-box-containing protein